MTDNLIICDNGNHRLMTDEEKIARLQNIESTNAAYEEQSQIMATKIAAIASARAKLAALGLNEAEITALVG